MLNKEYQVDMLMPKLYKYYATKRIHSYDTRLNAQNLWFLDWRLFLEVFIHLNVQIGLPFI